VISNQRPSSETEFSHTKDTKKKTIQFDKEGICSACRIAEDKKNKINWKERDKELRELCDKFRSKDGSYDCLVPGSGGKDSFYAAHILKYEYGMHPLTTTWAPNIYTDWGWKNFQSWIHAGFDNHLITPNGRVHRLLTRIAVENLFHPFQPFILGQKAMPPKIAVMHKIPLVFYGENEAEYGNPKQDSQTALRAWSYFTQNDKDKIYIAGSSLAELADQFASIKGEVRYLGYYLKWHPQGAYYYAVEHGDFQASPERTPGTYSKYNSIDDKIDDFHYYTTFIKFGIGRATYDAAQEIRSGEITRDEGVALVKRFDGEYPERFAEEIFRYLNIDEKKYPKMNKEYFMDLADKFRSPHLWKKESGKWKLRCQVS
jgi:N-acetyl sugar amidotransferase